VESKQYFGVIEECCSFIKNDSVIVKKGIYYITNLIIDKPIYLIGGESQPQNYPIFDANYKGEIITVKSSGVYIGKIEFQHVGETSSIDWAGIKVLESSNVILKIIILEIATLVFIYRLVPKFKCLAIRLLGILKKSKLQAMVSMPGNVTVFR
jgi:hypothetical protein